MLRLHSWVLIEKKICFVTLYLAPFFSPLPHFVESLFGHILKIALWRVPSCCGMWLWPSRALCGRKLCKRALLSMELCDYHPGLAEKERARGGKSVLERASERERESWRQSFFKSVDCCLTITALSQQSRFASLILLPFLKYGCG